MRIKPKYNYKQNIEITRAPTEEVVKEAVFNLNKENACGANGFSDEFFKHGGRL